MVKYLGALIVDPASPAGKPGQRTVPGYDPKAHYDQWMDKDAFIIDEARMLLSMTLAQRDALRDYITKTSGDKIEDILGGESKEGRAIDGIFLGPLDYDVVLAKNLVGKGEMLLIELTLHRPSDELQILSEGYKNMFGDDLAEDILTDDTISLRVRRLCAKAIQVQRPPDNISVISSLVSQDVESLVKAEDTGDDRPYFEIFVERPYPHIAAVIAEFEHKHKKLKKAVKNTLGTKDGMSDAILYMIQGIKPKKGHDGSIWRDAKLLEATMKGWGTRDGDLMYRLTRASWDPRRLHAIKEAYEKKYGTTLAKRIKSDTSGGYKDILMLILHTSYPT
ncbi:hypothetical protein H1R20_g10088, partial [Candolleomyces eurysporus]